MFEESEGSAATAGRGRAVWETGTVQPRTIALRDGAGDTPIAAFGVDRRAPAGRCSATFLPRPR